MDKKAIMECVEQLFAKYPKLKNLPVDILTLIETEFCMDIIPFDGLSKKYEVDAALTQDFSGIYVDKRDYDFLDTIPQWKQNRLRFTLAHELGHLILHKEKAPEFKSESDFITYFSGRNGSEARLEREANEFAGRLLVPAARLTEFYDAFVKNSQRINLDANSRRRFCEAAAGKFGVHADVIGIRLETEGLWLAS